MNSEVLLSFLGSVLAGSIVGIIRYEWNTYKYKKRMDQDLELQLAILNELKKLNTSEEAKG